MTLKARLSRAFGVRVSSLRRLSGGDVSEVHAVRLADGRHLVLKRADTAAGEGRMLAAIRAAGCPAPKPLLTGDGFLVMERLTDGGLPGPGAWETAGRAVARLHGTYGDAYGWDEDHAFGPVAIPNAPAEDWPRFWAENRILAAPDALPDDIRVRVEALVRTLPGRLPAAPPRSLLHGDLWSGNLLFGPSGFTGLIDPAAYYGDAEVDLAMMTLFGEMPPYFLEGYGPLREGWEDRRPIYQLWPALVHLRLFGVGYRHMVTNLLARAGA